MNDDQLPWSVKVRAEDIPDTGKKVELSPDEATRAKLAKLAGVLDVLQLDAEFELTRQGGDGVNVTGKVAATVRQTCGVSLEPMDNEVLETFDLSFVPPSQLSESPAAESEDVLEEGPEPLQDGAVDLGAIATEFLVLGIDPYPRKEGAVFADPAGPSERSTPFDVLAALKGS